MLQALPVDSQEIVVTASRVAQAEEDSAASVTIIDQDRIERLGEPLIPALLRLSPSVSVSTSGPAGSLTEVRIRGSEANHTLLFVDGIRANDPAAGNVPRFELLNADLFSRVEVVRGPQSALWGSEAIGGIVSVGAPSAKDDPLLSALAEGGSFRFRRAAVQTAAKSGDLALSGALGWQRARGIDSFDGNGDRDGYRNVSGRAAATWSPRSSLALGVSGFALSGQSQYDGYSPVTFLHADTLDSTENRLSAGRIWSRIGDEQGKWVVRGSTSLLRSSNRNLDDGDEINQTWGRRRASSLQLEHRFATGTINHVLVAAAEQERAEFRSRDVIYGGFSNQDRSRRHASITGEWQASAGPVRADIAVRRDAFSRFKDATTLRASLLGEIGGGFSLAASYGEGIAQPTFFDLYGFFPGSFQGNPDLKPESSRGVELSARYRRDGFHGSLTWYRQRLHDEIVDLFDPVTFTSSTANRAEKSRRSGLEAEAGFDIGIGTLTATYAYLKASQPNGTPGSQIRELRRPKHSGSVALDGARGRFSYGSSLAFTGAHDDRRDSFPYDVVSLRSYWLADARVAYDVHPGIQLFARAANAFDDHRQDVFGYRTEGRSVHAGLRLTARR
jgi:vitamin B12 transporter